MNIRSISCLLSGLLALFIFLLSTPKEMIAAKGMLLPTLAVRASISPNEVRFYNQAPAVSFKKMGAVRVELKFSTLDLETENKLFEKVKSLAASVGANGVIIDMVVPSEMVGKTLTFVGTAIYIPSATRGAA